MKKYVIWILGITVGVFCIDWAVLGVKLLDGNYDFLIEAWVGAVCWLVLMACVFYKAFSNRCPHCGKRLWDNGAFCPHCGKRIREAVE